MAEGGYLGGATRGSRQKGKLAGHGRAISCGRDARSKFCPKPKLLLAFTSFVMGTAGLAQSGCMPSTPNATASTPSARRSGPHRSGSHASKLSPETDQHEWNQ